MNSVPHCKILTQGFDLENWMEKRWKIGGQVDSWCWEVLQLPSALTTSLAIKTGTTSRSLVCTCSKSLWKLIESKYKQCCPSFPNRHLCRCFKQSYPKHRKVSSYGKHWQFLHGRAEVDWMCDSWVERHPPWSFTSTIKAGFLLSLHKHTWKPMYPGVSGSYLYLAKAYSICSEEQEYLTFCRYGELCDSSTGLWATEEDGEKQQSFIDLSLLLGTCPHKNQQCFDPVHW